MEGVKGVGGGWGGDIDAKMSKGFCEPKMVSLK